MLAVSLGRLTLLSTPFGRRGFFFKEWSEGEAWKKIKITAEQCPRISPEFLREERLALGDWWFQQEYLCEFSENVDAYFTYEEIHAAITNEVKPLWGPDGRLIRD
jgi:nitrogenase molybdenum-iron protein alpha/beta subunit